MPPELRELLDALRQDASPSEYFRQLVEADAARRSLESPQLALAEVARAQAELPSPWFTGDLTDPLEEARESPDAGHLVGAHVEAGAVDLQKVRPAT